LTWSDGKTYPNPKADRPGQKKLAQLQKELTRRQKGGKNREKTQLKLAKVHRRIADSRADHLHQLTTYLAKNHGEVKIEDLNVSGRVKNDKLAGAIADGGFYEFRRFLEYKCQWYGSKLTRVNPWYPSSQIGSNCGQGQKMPLDNRQYDCPNCHLSIEWD
jgi:putative transposase